MKTDAFTHARLVQREDFTDDLALFRFAPDLALDFEPGQYATIGLQHGDDRPVLRAYSIVSAPHEPTLEFFIELVEDGKLTPMLWELTPGDTVWVRKKIVGRFVLDAERPHHAMIATVTGIAPFLSMARAQVHALERGTRDVPHNLLILHGASRSWELGTYLDELQTLDAQHGWLTYVPTVSRPWEDPDWSGECGRCDDVVRKHLDAAGWAADAVAGYACGHPRMIDHVKKILERARLDPAHIHEEKYFTESAPSTSSTDAASASPSKRPPAPAASGKRPAPKKPPLPPSSVRPAKGPPSS